MAVNEGDESAKPRARGRPRRNGEDSIQWSEAMTGALFQLRCVSELVVLRYNGGALRGFERARRFGEGASKCDFSWLIQVQNARKLVCEFQSAAADPRWMDPRGVAVESTVRHHGRRRAMPQQGMWRLSRFAQALVHFPRFAIISKAPGYMLRRSSNR